MTDLTKALSELRRLKLGDEIDAEFVSTILDAARTGDLIPKADADLAVALMVEKAAERLEANRAQLNFAAILGLLRDAPLPEAIVTALSGWLDAIAEAIRAIAPASALSELQALRDERDRLDAVTNTLSEMWEGEQTARHSAEAELVTLRAQVERLTGALTIAANRLHRCSVDYDTGTREFIEVGGWADEARAALTEGAAP